jgi:serine protease
MEFQMLKRRLLSLSCAVLGASSLTGCEQLISDLLCSEDDYDTDPTCIDPDRAQLAGKVVVPEASNASTSTKRLDATSTNARTLMAAAIREQHGIAPVARDAASRSRVPKAGPWKFEHKKQLVEKWRDGEVIVRAHESIRERKAEITTAISHFLGDRYLVDIQQCGTEFRCLVDIKSPDGKRLDNERTAQVARRLNEMPFLKYAEKNLILDKAAFPSDEFFTFQWHYNSIDIPAAWDITTGSPDVVGAIIDTGIVFDHPDLGSRVIGGADLISDANVANDGDGRDDDGDDAGDNSCGSGCHSHHGSHVAGTMGAETNNGDMVAGITWEGGLLAVRVLGEGGGSLSDIADGIVWSVGESVDGVSNNPTPADVLNLSLGGGGQSEAMNEAIQLAVDSGAIVLVAAGNENVDASESTPANAPAAITVAAVGYNFGGEPQRASYSNFGDTVEVAAPGGEQAEDSDGDGNGDGVLSTIGDFVGFYQGTSMATPHVAGVAMLMKSVNPELTQAEALQILQDTADTNITCDEGCGAGNINAFAAVTAANGGDVSGLSSANVRVGLGVTTASIVFRNLGNEILDVDFSVGGADRDSVTLSSTNETIGPKARATITATIARDADAADVGSVTIRGVSGDVTSELRLDWTADKAPVVAEVFVMPIKIDGDTLTPVTSRLVTTNAINDFAYNLFNLDPGTYMVIGVFDGDNNGSFDDAADSIGFLQRAAADGESCTGNGCNQITLAAGDALTGTSFVVAPGFNGGDDVGGNGDGAMGDACSSSTDCGSGLYCEAGFNGGYCTADCASSSSDCPSGSTCFDIGVDDEPYQICFLDCTDDSDCGRDGYVCDVLDGIGSCIPG